MVSIWQTALVLTHLITLTTSALLPSVLGRWAPPKSFIKPKFGASKSYYKDDSLKSYESRIRTVAAVEMMNKVADDKVDLLAPPSPAPAPPIASLASLRAQQKNLDRFPSNSTSKSRTQHQQQYIASNHIKALEFERSEELVQSNKLAQTAHAPGTVPHPVKSGQNRNVEFPVGQNYEYRQAMKNAEQYYRYLKHKPNKHSGNGRFLDSDVVSDAMEMPVEEKGDHFEGDIILYEHQANDIMETFEEIEQKPDHKRVKRKFIGPLARRWPIAQAIPYSFDGSHTLKEQSIIELALAHWSNITCLEFERKFDEPRGNRIVFTDVDGCASNVGRHPLGEPQYVSLAPECMRLGVIAHEVAHALGFWHEQSRPDRDNYVTVVWQNIDRNSKGQFLKEQMEDVDSANVPYDYGSIMHYRSKAFARYDDLFTIETNINHYQRTIGQRDQLSFNDIRLMNKIYCSSVCPELPCERGGYTDPRHCDRCKCPDGFTGRLCENVMNGYGAECGGRLLLTDGWLHLQSPAYPNEFKEGQECSWLLVAPAQQHVELQFVGTFDMYCKARHALCMDYVEIRNTTDFANTGMRYCCYGTPQGSIFSSTDEMLVLFRSFYQNGRGFQARARAVVPSGSWSTWGPWTQCSGSCGGCGVRERTRTCPQSAVCHGAGRETEPCNTNPCELCPITSERTVLEPCKEKCCAGFFLNGGSCLQSFPARDQVIFAG